RLDFVECEVHTGPVAGRAQPREVARRRFDDADVHHDRLDDHAGDLTGILEERALDGVEVAERHDDGETSHVGRYTFVVAHRNWVARRPGVLDAGIYGDLDRVVMTVIGAFDLENALASGADTHEVDRAHGRFGTGV